MRATAFFAIVFVVLFVPVCLYASGNDLPLQSYLNAMKALSRNCSMDYVAVRSHSGHGTTTIYGRMAVRSGMFYDSSNERFVLMNGKWLLLAEHSEKLLSVIYLPDWKAKMGKDFELDISAYLLGSTELKDFTAFKVTSSGADSFIVNVSYPFGTGQTIDLTLHYVRGSVIPGRYEGVISYGASREEQGAIRFICSNIRAIANEQLFDDKRLIKQTGARKAQMRRYNDYRMYRRNG